MRCLNPIHGAGVLRDLVVRQTLNPDQTWGHCQPNSRAIRPLINSSSIPHTLSSVMAFTSTTMFFLRFVQLLFAIVGISLPSSKGNVIVLNCGGTVQHTLLTNLSQLPGLSGDIYVPRLAYFNMFAVSFVKD